MGELHSILLGSWKSKASATSTTLARFLRFLSDLHRIDIDIFQNVVKLQKTILINRSLSWPSFSALKKKRKRKGYTPFHTSYSISTTDLVIIVICYTVSSGIVTVIYLKEWENVITLGNLLQIVHIAVVC